MNVGGNEDNNDEQQKHHSEPDRHEGSGRAPIIDGVEAGKASDAQQKHRGAADPPQGDSQCVAPNGFDWCKPRGGFGIEQVKPAREAAQKGEDVNEDGGNSA